MLGSIIPLLRDFEVKISEMNQTNIISLEPEEIVDYQDEFNKIRPILSREIRKITHGIDDLSQAMGLSKPTIYGYLGGKTPDISRCIYLVNYAKNLFEKLNLKTNQI